MSFEIKEGNIWLNPNKAHVHGDRLPCLKGDMNIAGIIYEVAIWAPKEGKKAYFGVAKPKQAKEPELPLPPPLPAPVAEDGLPF
jgi:hypothetical protein